METMLREALRKFRELRTQFENCLLGDDGNVWEAEAKKFLARRPCWTNGQVMPVAEPKPPPSLLIDLSADPFVPSGWGVEEHRKGDQFKWDPAKVTLYFSDQQQRGTTTGHNLREDLHGKPVFNANVLDWLLANPQHIPAEWKGKWIFFWGTIYRDSFGDLCVRCLHWSGGQWDWHCSRLGRGWGSRDPAAVLAS